MDYSDFISKFDVPTVSHEIGQWCVYPNLKEIKKYTGVLRPTSFEIVRDFLDQNHMFNQAEDFLMASGKLQALLYKEEIETALRTPGFGGFQLLDLHDFPGQGTAPMGVLDAFWDEKGYIKSEEYRRFCGPALPLLKMKKCTWQNNEVFDAEAWFANYGPETIRNAKPLWQAKFNDGKTFASRSLPVRNVPTAALCKLGEITLPLRELDSATRLTITLSIEGTEFANHWDIWVYPERLTEPKLDEVLITDSLDDKTKEAFAEGQTVLVLANVKEINSDVPPGFSSIFWNTSFTGRQAPHTLGILCDPNHPALKHFPTEFHSNWQWWDLIRRSKAMVFGSFDRGLRPIVQVIDDWNTNRRLGLLFEAQVGNGRLLVSSMDLKTDLDNRPVARQMLYSLKKYLTSESFEPLNKVDFQTVKSLFRD